MSTPAPEGAEKTELQVPVLLKKGLQALAPSTARPGTLPSVEKASLMPRMQSLSWIERADASGLEPASEGEELMLGSMEPEVHMAATY